MPGSQADSRAFTLSVFQPLPAGGAFLETLRVPAQHYRHTISAFGGFDRASFRLVDTLPVLHDWYEEGLGRMVVVYDETLQPMWEGFVNQVTLRQSGLELRRGPLTRLANCVCAFYSSLDTSTTPPTPGIRKVTPTVDDPESQARYGIWPQVLSLAGVTDDNALSLRDTYLAEHAQPELASHYALDPGEPGLHVECLGFVHTLTYPYNQTATGGTVGLSNHLQAVLAAAPNAWLSGDMARITPNPLPVSRWENDNRLALGVIRGLTAMGDARATRHLFGIYEGRQAVYGPVPSEWAYTMRLDDPGQTIYDRVGGRVAPWSVRPGRWLLFSDLLPGVTAGPAPARDDPRLLFIESVHVSVPLGLQLSGGRVDTLGQHLARLGLAGTSG